FKITLEVPIQLNRRLHLIRPRTGHGRGDTKGQRGALADAEVQTAREEHRVAAGDAAVADFVQRGVHVTLDCGSDGGEPIVVWRAVQEVTDADVVEEDRQIAVIRRDGD